MRGGVSSQPAVASVGVGPGGRPDRAFAVLAWLAAGLVLSMATWFSATAVIPSLREDWSLSASAAAWLTISVQIGFVLGALASSVLNLPDLVAPRRLFVIGSLVAAAANLGLLAAQSVFVAVPLRMATGAGLALVYPPALKLLATWFRAGRGFALGVSVGAITLGSALPHLINGVGGLDWHLVVGATSLLSLLGAATVIIGVRDGPFPFPPAIFDPHQVRRAFRDRRVALATIGYFGHMWELYAVWAWFNVFFAVTLNLNGSDNTAATAALATFAVIAAGAAGCVVGGLLADTRGRARTNAAMLLVSGCCALSIGFLIGLGPSVVLVVGLIWGFTVVGDSAQFSVMVTEYAEQEYVGTTLTLQLALGFGLTVATIWLVPVVAEAIGWRYAFAPLAIGPLVGFVAMVRLAQLEGHARRASAP